MDSASRREEGGVVISYSIDRVTVVGKTIAGMNGLKFFSDNGRNIKGIRMRYKIDESEWPSHIIHRMVNGTIWKVEFLK